MFKTKESIKENLWQYASEKWNVEDPKASFDPLIDLLFGGVSYEVEKLYHTIYESQSRLFNHLSEYLLPDQYTAVQPAHAVLICKAIAEDWINPEDAFFDSQDRDLSSYSPAGCYELKPIDIAYIAMQKELSLITDKYKKESKYSFKIGKELPPNVIFIGIKSSSDWNLKDKNISIYFHSTDGKVSLPYSSLPLTQAAHFDQIIKAKTINFNTPINEFFTKKLTDLGLESTLDRFVFSYYQDRYLQFDFSDIVVNSTIPLSLSEYLTPESIEQLKNEKITWLKLEMSKEWEPFLKSLLCLPNAIPVINRKLVTVKEDNPDTKVVRELTTNKLSFLSIQSLESNGAPYELFEEEGCGKAENSPGSFQILHGGVQAVDSRSVSSLINNLLDVIEESGHLDQSPGTGKYSEMLQSLRKDNPASNPTSTLVIINKESVNQFILKYWVSPSAMLANLGKRDLTTDNSSIKEKRGYLLTLPIGFKPEPTTAQKIKKWRYGLLTRDRICTHEDIRSFVYSQMAEFSILSLEIVPKAIQSSKGGLERILNVQIRMEEEAIHDRKFNYIIQETEKLLNTKTNGWIPISLTVN